MFLVGCALFLSLTPLEHQTQAQGGSTIYVAPGRRLLTGGGLSSTTSATTLLVATSADYWPMEYISDTQIVGHDIDLMNAIATEMGVTVVYTDVPWGGIFDGLIAGEYDAIIAALTVTPKREEMIDFTLPYVTVNSDEDFAIAVQEGDDVLRCQINEALLQLRDDGALEAIISAIAADKPEWHAHLPDWAHCWVRINDDPIDYASVQAAVDAANDRDIVKVAGYCAGVEARAEVTQTVYISKTLTLRGGYTVTNWTVSDPLANPTTLDAQGQGRVVYITGDISPTIEGLRITEGDAAELGGHPYPWWEVDTGGGVYVITATVTINNNQLINNTASWGGGMCLSNVKGTISGNSFTINTAADVGGGLYLDSSEATISNNSFSANTANIAAGLFLESSHVTVNGNTIVSNTASTIGEGWGGGLYLSDIEGTISGNSFTANTANGGGGLFLDGGSITLGGNIFTANTANRGGGLHLRESDAILINNVVAGNQANTIGSGLYVYDSSLHLLHNTTAHNTGGDGSAIYVTDGGTVALTNTILVSHTVGITVTAGNTATLEATLWGTDTWANHSDWGGTGTIITGTRNYWGDPDFVDPDAGDYHIGPGSAAIDAGVDAGVSTDIDDEPRPDGCWVDIGADEYQGRTCHRIYLPLMVRDYPLRVGMVTDIGGVDDRSFNATAWAGVQRAIEELCVEGQYLESHDPSDYAPNMNHFIQQGYDLIVTVGFMLGDATKTASEANPDTDFTIVDFSYDPPLDNVRGLTFATDEAAFLAGYLAGAMTHSGKVGTFGGVDIAPVTIFMVGFENGVAYYNEQHGTSVEVLGTELFIGNFESIEDGRSAAESLMDEGADIILPVAGYAGLGAAAACQERGAVMIGVDTDWYVSAPEYKEVYLTSVLKGIDNTVFQAIKDKLEGLFTGGKWVGTLENDGVGIAPLHEYDNEVPQMVKDQLEGIRQGIFEGTIDTGWPSE